MRFSALDRVRAAIPAALIVLLALLALPALASAATLEVRENSSGATFELQGDTSADTVTLGPPTNGSPGFLKFQVTDTAGFTGPNPSACSGVGNTRTCELARPRPGFSTLMRFLLGGGANELKATEFTGNQTIEIATEVTAGGANDKIFTGATLDTVEAGGGEDLVETASNNDRALATSAPDAADTYDLGAGFDQVSYRPRSVPVLLAGNVGGAQGEGDALTEVEAVVGGAGDDALQTSASIRTLDGGPGSDLLTGGEEEDTLFGGLGNDTLIGNGANDILEGGEGDDTMVGGAGDDRIDEDRQEAEADHVWIVGLAPGQSGGNDTADGGAGNDRVDLGPGRDKGEGGEGIDLLFGGADNDELNGGLGDDGIAGEGGADTLLGGSGFDEVLAGHLSEPKFQTVQPIDSWRDKVDCGPNFDVAVANRWDSVVSCEHIRSVPVLEVRRVKRNVRKGTVQLGIALVGPGKVTTIGGKVKAVTRGVPVAGPEKRSVVVLPITLRGHSLGTLKRHHVLTVRFGIVFRQPGGFPRTEPVKVTLVMRGR